MATRIKILPEEIVSKIAAGEVVERPASVVKELVENAIDAGGRDITIDIRGGGRSYIQVVDDGCGMGRDDALLAIERHATSKLSNAEDLFAIRTLGFRGEALATIAGVSRFELITRMAESAAATRIYVQGGTVRSVDEVGAPAGTSITVRDLFFNIPARLKFMKSAAIEAGHIIDLVTRLSLSREGVAMKLVRGPETLLQVSAVTRGVDRLVELLGPDLVNHLYPFQGERAGVQVHGFLSSPEISRSGWAGLYAFVNGRFLRDRVISHAVAEAYRGIIPKGRYPIAVIYLEVNPSEVDVNVHPGKIEVRFSRPRTVSDLIIEAVRGTLVRAPWRQRALASSGWAPPQSTLFPEAPADVRRQAEAAEQLLEDLSEERQAARVDAAGRAPSRHWQPAMEPDPDEERARLESLLVAAPELAAVPDAASWPSTQARAPGAVGHADPGNLRPPAPLGPAPMARSIEPPRSHDRMAPPDGREVPLPTASLEPTPGYGALRSQGAGFEPTASTGFVGSPDSNAASPAFPTASRDVGPGTASEVARTAEVTGRSEPPSVAIAPVEDAGADRGPRSTFGRETAGILPGLEDRNFSRMRIIGQYANCFILCQDGDELVIIDQHAAHERVTFEQLRAAYEGIGARNQLLLTPHIVDLPRREAQLLTEYLDSLESLGLEVAHFGGNSFAVKAMPVVLLDEDPASLLADLAADLVGNVARQPLQDRIYLLLATMACHGSIRANRRMTVPEMEALLKLLDGTDFSFACPHGRPLISRASRRDIEKLFKRT